MSAAATPAATSPAGSRQALLANRNFRWLLGGGLVSMLGDQFTLIALPWLVLQLSGDPLALGGVLALMSLPRALFILVGGAVVDRHSPRRVLLLSKLVNAALLALLAGLLWGGQLQLWMLNALALALGLASAFSFPASSAILPRSLPGELLRPANGLLMGLRQLSMLLGPVLAGALIALQSGRPGGEILALAAAFAIDALSYVLSAWALLPVRVCEAGAGATAARGSLLRSIVDALLAMWRDRALRALCLYVAAVSVLVGGPIQVALPVLAHDQLPGGASSLGLLLAGHGAGVLAGMALSGWRPHWRLKTLGATVLLIDAVAGLVFLPFGHIHAAWQGVALLMPLGAMAGFVQVAVLSWIQQRVPAAMLGRAMSLFMFVVMGLAPLASAAAGAALRVWTPATLFSACGAALLVIVLLGALLSPIRTIRDA